MPWVTPITNHTADGVETFEDYNRQSGNLMIIITDILPALGYTATPGTADTVDMTFYPFAALLNALEANLAAIEASGLPLPPTWGDAVIWAAGQRAPDYADANRWERNAQIIHDMAEIAAAAWQGNYYGNTNLDLLRGYNL